MTGQVTLWARVKFGDVVRNVGETVADPKAQGLERAVGLDDLDSGSLALTRFGQVSDGTTFTKRFSPGHVLFGKRRAYQRKVAVANFDGVCSGDILVFEAVHDQLYQELLPFITQSERFFNHALRTSRGSLSPRTSWKDLAAFEFDLPPLDEQKRIAAMLWSAERLKDDLLNLAASVAGTKRSLWLEPRSDRGGSVLPLGEVIEVCQYGLSKPAGRHGRYPLLRMTNIADGTVVESELVYIDLSDEEYAAFRVHPGDILFNRSNSAELVGKVGIYRLSGEHVFASYLIRLRARQDVVLPEYLNAYLNSPVGQNRIRLHATKGVSQSNINATNLKKVLVPVPQLDDQRLFGELLEKVRRAEAVLAANVQSLARVRERLMLSALHTA